MPAADIPEASVAAFLLAAALERYQAHWDQLIESWFDRSRCDMVNQELDEIQKLRAALPQLGADMMEVMMRHAQLLRSLMKAAGAEGAAAQVEALRRKHRSAIEAMRGKCERLFARAE
jgi:iron-sulfur cluster repair protein YtfE (RIC family)